MTTMSKGEASAELLRPIDGIRRASNEVSADEITRHLDREATGRAAIARKKAQVMGALDRVRQTGRHQTQGWAYATDSDVLDAIRPALAEAGLALTLNTLEVTKTEHGMTRNEKRRYLSQVRVGIILTCADTGAQEHVEWVGEGIDEEDKGIPKALTAAEKYYLLKTFLISSGDGEDGSAPQAQQDAHPNAPRQKSRPPKPATKGGVSDVTAAMTAAGVKDPRDIAQVAGAIAGRDLGSVFDLTADEVNKVKAIVNHAADLDAAGAYTLLMDLANNDPASLATKGALTKAHRATSA